jgi:hypothetical protein
MRVTWNVPAALLALLIFAGSPAAQTYLTDPLEILGRHYEAIGGLERLKAETTLYLEGTLSVAGLSGTLRYWNERPGRHRTEVDLGVFKQTIGDNGDVAWELDANGKLRLERDEVALRTRDVYRRIEEFEHMEPHSDVFEVTLEGVEELNGVPCYVVKVANSIDDGYRLMCIDTTDFLERKTSDIRNREESHTLHADFRDVGGILRPFRDETEEMPTGQIQIVEISTYETGVEIDPSLFEPPEEGADDFSFVDGGTFVDVPFEFIERHIFIPVTIDCSQRLWALDTGASSTVIDSDYADELGLATSGEIIGTGIGSTVECSFVTLPALTVPGVEFEEQQAVAVRISSLFRRTSDMEIGGILGYDFLSRFVTRVDIANEMLTFYHPESFEYDGVGEILDAPLSENVFAVPAVVDGEHGGRWTLDLGAGGLSFLYPYAKKNGLLDRQGVETVGFGAGGRIDYRTSLYDTIELGGVVLKRPLISHPAGDVVGAFGGADHTGNLGNSVFRHLVLYLDYERQRVIVERGDDVEREFSVDRSGVSFWRPDLGDIEILYVSDGTPAADAGLSEGDVLVAINGIAAEHLDLPSLRELMRAEAGTAYRLDVSRAGELLQSTIELRDIY